MASARKKNGKWYYRITITNGNGTHKYIERGSFKTKREAIEAGVIKERAIKNGEDISRQKFMSFNFLAEEWLTSSRLIYKTSTILDYRTDLNNRILPVIGDYDIHAITRYSCQEIINKMVGDHLTRNYIIEVKSTMSRCFRYAIEMGYLKENPCKNLIIPEKRSRVYATLNKEKEHYSVPKETLKLIFEKYHEGTNAFIALLLSYRLGLRKGEIFGLTIEDIDIPNNTVHIRRQLQYDKSVHKYYVTDPKYCNPGSGRDVTIDDNTADILKRHINLVKSFKSAPLYFIDKDGYLTEKETSKLFHPLNIFIRSGKMLTPTVINGVMVWVQANVDPNWTIHAMRHTHASECIAAGMSPVSVQKRLGHKNLTTTYKYYIHETETQVTEAHDIIEKMFS